MADEDLNRPYIGYRSAGRRPESQQDRRASADAPLAALRGFLSGVAGAPGDLESLVRMLPGLSERTVLPTSSDVEQRLPLRTVSETPVGRLATTGGQLAGGFYNGPGSPLRVIAKAPSIAGRAGREFLQSNVPVHVIKPKGGNWLTGSVEEAIRPLKRGLPERPGEVPRNVPPGVSWRGMVSAMENQPEGLAYLDELRTANPEAYARLYSDAALNKWLDTKLGKYMRNEMGTPEDPIRALAEQGVLHFTPERQILNSTTAFQRSDAGFPRHGVAQAQLAKNWEDLADQAILPRTAGQQLMAEYPYNAETMPWLEKVPPETMVYAARSRSPEELGFGHLRDELRNALNPESGLPANLLLTPEQLGRVSTPQAVELVHKINEYRAAEKAAADAARSQNAATVLHKDYPEAGYRWVELRQPEVEKLTQLPEGWRVLEDSNAGQKFHYVVNEHGGTIPGSGFIGRTPEEAVENTLRGLNTKRDTQALEDALKYEGDTMGHCVGGYCPDVLEGKSRIFSLRSSKGEPHVTIEAAPSRESAYDYWTQTKGLGPESDEFDQWVAANKGNLPKGGYDAWYRRWAEETGRSVEMPPPSIVQIKGKQNRAPKEDYLPYVQDFVRSQKWGRVGDFANTGLYDVTALEDLARFMPQSRDILEAGTGPRLPLLQRAKEAGLFGDQRYMTRDEWEGVMRQQLMNEGVLPGKTEGFASGGLVTYNPAEVERLTAPLRAELGLQ